MTALSITKANVAYVSGPIAKDAYAGEAFDAGDLVYKNASGNWLKALHTGTAIQAGSLGLGLALATADAVGARVSIALPGAIVAVGAGTAGVIYCVGQTAGDIIPSADLGSGDKVTVAGVGIGTNQLQLAHVYNAGSELA